MTRLCRSVGCLGFSEFRVLLARDVSLTHPHVIDRANDLANKRRVKTVR